MTLDAIADLRRRNLVPAAAMPLINPFGNNVDSGAFPETFDHALARADVAGFAARCRESEARGMLRGLGFAYHIKATGGSPSENVDIRFEDDGRVTLITGTQTIGQGHETTFPQILADRLGVPNERIRLVQGDTDLIPLGGGHGSSRATYMGGTAIWRAADEIIAGYRQFIARSHSRGVRIYGATLTPFSGAAYYSAAGDVKRREVNRWIRTAGEFDAVIDFDAVVRDPSDPSRILPAYDSGDHLHPSDAGYQAMANAIDLRLFKVSGGDHTDQN